MSTPIKLTQYCHGGGCGCKLAPNMLQDMLASLPAQPRYPNLMVGTESSDDAAVYRLNDSQAIVVTTDFFMPIVDDPTDFGRIAATNALPAGTRHHGIVAAPHAHSAARKPPAIRRSSADRRE